MKIRTASELRPAQVAVQVEKAVKAELLEPALVRVVHPIQQPVDATAMNSAWSTVIAAKTYATNVLT